MEASDFTRRDLTLAAAAFLCGIVFLLTLPSIPDAPVLVAVGCMGACACVKHRYYAAKLVIWGCCGFLFAAGHAHTHLKYTWPQEAADSRIRAEVIVDSIPEPRGPDWA